MSKRQQQGPDYLDFRDAAEAMQCPKENFMRD